MFSPRPPNSRNRRQRFSISSSRATLFNCAILYSSHSQARWPNPRSGRAWYAPSASSTRPSCDHCGTPPERAAKHSREAFRTAVGTNPMFGQSGAVRAVRDAGTHIARRPCRRGSAVGVGPEGGNRLSGGGSSRWSCRRQRAVRCDLAEPLWSDVHGARLRGRLPADQPRGSQDRPRHARNARRDKCAARRQTCPDKS